MLDWTDHLKPFQRSLEVQNLPDALANSVVGRRDHKCATRYVPSVGMDKLPLSKQPFRQTHN